MLWKPKLTYNGTTIAFAYPMRPWRRRLHPVARGRKVASGARESFSLRNERVRRFRLVCTEAEYQALESFVEWVHANWGTSFTFDQGNGTAYSCYLESPAPGADLQDTPTDTPLVEVEIELVKANGGKWTEVLI